MAVRLLVGLGNPGPRYRDTRHNLGFQVVEAVARKLAVELAEEPLALVGRRAAGEDLAVLAVPLTYVNRSGAAVRVLSEQLGAAATEILVVLDDMQLPLGHLRLRARGSSGGHRGLASILAALGTEAVPRLRVGIGPPPPGMDAADYVLAPFAPEERPRVQAAVREAAAVAGRWLAGESVEVLMNQINRRVAPPEAGSEEGASS